MTLKSDLIAAKALIDTPEKWMKGGFWDEKRTCFCVAGALRETETKLGEFRRDMWRLVIEALPEWAAGYIPDFNDAPETTHADVMALFDRAIAAAPDDEVA